MAYLSGQLANPPTLTTPKTTLTREKLLSLNNISLRPSVRTISTLRKLHLLRIGITKFRHYRGNRSGQRVAAASPQRHLRPATQNSTFGPPTNNLWLTFLMLCREGVGTF